MSLPLLRTPRLTLRPWTLDDIDELHALWIRPGVRRYLWDDVVIAREQAEATVAANVEAAEAEGIGGWRLLPDGATSAAGFVGLIRLKPDMEPELLYGLAPEWWGKGLATEAARAVVAYAFDTLGFSRVLACTDAPNVASARVMERLGMRFTRSGTLNGLDTVFYELRREDVITGQTNRAPR